MGAAGTSGLADVTVPCDVVSGPRVACSEPAAGDWATINWACPAASAAVTANTTEALAVRIASSLSLIQIDGQFCGKDSRPFFFLEAINSGYATLFRLWSREP